MLSHPFIGDKTAPTALATVQRRRPALGTGNIPPELREMMNKQFIYLETDSKKKPEVNVVPVEQGGRHMWKIEAPVTDDLRGARPGLSQERTGQQIP